MEKVTLYKYVRDGGGVTVSPSPPREGVPYTTMFRIIAGEGMLVTRGGEPAETFSVVDTDTDDGWFEVPDTEEENARG